MNSITKARRQRYNAAYRARPTDDAQRLARAAYMRHYRARLRTEAEVKACAPGGRRTCAGTMTPAQEAKAEVYRELGYRHRPAWLA